LTGPPFALVAVVHANAAAEEVESTLEKIVEEMRSKANA
jgi:hypothetical protein